MKILGKRSLSSIVTVFLEILLIICIFMIISGIIILVKNFELYINLKIDKILIIVYLSSIPSAFLIMQFIDIFKGLRSGNIFDKTNLKRLKISYIISFIICLMYIINGVIIIFNNIEKELFIMYSIFTYVISLVFLIFGIGLMVLSEIYKRAIKYKEENELTI